jgi:hypothetical protein
MTPMNPIEGAGRNDASRQPKTLGSVNTGWILMKIKF